MARDYAKKGKPVRKRKKSTKSRKGWLYLLVLIGAGFIVYRYSSLDVNKIQKDISKTLKLTKQSKQQSDKPKFEFYTRLPKGHQYPTKEKEKSSSVEKHLSSQMPSSSQIQQKQSNKRYVVQVASFKKFADADRLRASLILQGYQATLSKFTNNLSTWYRVEVGPFDSIEQARHKQQGLEQLNHTSLIKKIA